MEVEILEFIPDRKGIKAGYVDFKVTHTPEKYEIFRHVTYFEKENKKWLSVSAVERNGKWLPRYERKPALTHLLHQAVEDLERYLKGRSVHNECECEF